MQMTLDTPLTTATNTELAASVEANLFAFCRAAAKAAPEGELVETDRLCYQYTPFSNPMFTAIWRSRLAADEVDTAIEQTLEWYKQRRTPTVHWWMTGQNEPADLPQRLEAHGFAHSYSGSPGMIADITTLPQQVSMPDGFTMKRVEDEAALEDWLTAYLAAYPSITPIGGRTWVDSTLSIGIQRAPWQMYIGYWNGQPVATNMVFYGAGVAGLFAVGTVPEARGKGIGGAITLKPLWDAREQGYRYGVLFASKMGYPVYQRLGFREMGSPFGRYVWKNDSLPPNA